MDKKISWFTLLTVLCLWLSNPASAQCFSELRGGQSAEHFVGEATAADALVIFARAVRLFEPALPPFGSANTTLLAGLEPSSAAYQSGIYLSERGLLPANFSVENFDAALWLEMQNRLLDWYNLAPLTNNTTEEPLLKGQLIASLAQISLKLKEVLEPILLVASENRRADSLSFLSLIHLQGPYPRLIILRPLEGIDISRRLQTLFPLLNTCVSTIEKYVYAPQDTATRLFFSTNEAASYIVYSEPRNVGRLAVPAGEEVSFFQFKQDSLAGVERFSVVFAGNSPGAGAIISMLPRLRTNLGAGDIMGFFRQ